MKGTRTMGFSRSADATRGRWMALTAALLGWMFDGLEMGLFPQVARPSLLDLLGPGNEAKIGQWIAVATASFLVGAATGGVLFGWLGDRLGRVRAMTLSVLTYAIFTGLCSVAAAPWHLAALRFVSALGMGGEWSLGVALVMEVWPNQSRAFLAGLIGAAANVGYLLVGVLMLGLGLVLDALPSWFATVGISESVTNKLTAFSGWRLLMMTGAVPALLTFFIRLFVPESHRWEEERARGATSHWAARDLMGVGLGASAAIAIIYLWTADFSWPISLSGSVLALIIVTLGYLYPAVRYLQRLAIRGDHAADAWQPTVRRMLLAACLSGVPLLGTWAAIQWAPAWADQLANPTGTDGRSEVGAPGVPEAKAYTQICMSTGAIVGTIAAAFLGDWLGRRISYSLLCLASLGSVLLFFLGNKTFGPLFLVTVFLAGGISASFYGWLPLYLPELFRTRVRATGQGFSFNFGRIIAAVGALQTGQLMGLFGGKYPVACSIMSLIYLVGLALIWLAPETRGKPLPE
jgi:MFS family permease